MLSEIPFLCSSIVWFRCVFDLRLAGIPTCLHIVYAKECPRVLPHYSLFLHLNNSIQTSFCWFSPFFPMLSHSLVGKSKHKHSFCCAYNMSIRMFWKQINISNANPLHKRSKRPKSTTNPVHPLFVYSSKPSNRKTTFLSLTDWPKIFWILSNFAQIRRWFWHVTYATSELRRACASAQSHQSICC